MGWRWWKRRGSAPADEALAESRRARQDAETRGVEIRSIAGRLREIRDENHFAESIRHALGDD